MIRQLNKLKFSQQLFAYFLMFIIVPTFVVFVLYTILYVQTTTRNIVEYSTNALEIIDDNFTNYVNQINAMSDSLLYNKQFINIINSKSSGGYGFDNRYTLDLRESLNDIIVSFPTVETLVFVDNTNTVVSAGYPYYYQIDTIIEKYKEKMDSKNGGNVWVYLNSNGENKVMICRKLNNIDTSYKKHDLGYAIILIDAKTLYSYYRNYNITSNLEFYILDESDSIIYSNFGDDIGKEFTSITGYKNENSSNKKYIYIQRKLDINNWTIAYYIPRNMITSNIYIALLYMAVVTLICIALSIIISSFLAKNLNKPLVKLSKSMKKVEGGDFDIELKTRMTNEIGDLYKSFNIMVLKLNQLVNKNMAMQIKNKEAQIKAYQRQISPHFIYNTFEMIRMMAILNENDKIEETVTCLSEVFRFNLKAENEVKIEREILSIELYFKILKLRYGENFDYEIKVPDEIKKFYTLKFILQPFIENAILHGLEKVERKCYITIVAKKLEDEIIFIISDNGLGIMPERLAEIRKSLDDPNVEGGSFIGMKNVHQRIKLYYGDKYGIDIYSKYNYKTRITIHIPTYTKEEDSNV